MANKPNHKAATEVTVARLEERNAFEEFIFAHWWKGVLVFVAVAIGVVYVQTREEQIETANDASWTTLAGQLAFIETPGTDAEPEALKAAASDLDGTLAGPWAAALVAPAFADQGELGQALTELGSFASAYPNHALKFVPVEVDGTVANPVSVFRERLHGLEDFKAANPELFSNPPAPAEAPRVELQTSAGPIVIALYSDKSPNHTENFLTKVRAGEYDGTKFHRIIPGFMIQGGDPNSVDGEPSTWGQGGGDVTQPQEFSELAHFRGYLASAKRGGQTESSTYQFYITVGDPHHLNNQHTVFGQVLEGMDVADQIVGGEIEEGTTDRPAMPVTIQKAVVLTD